MAEKEKEGRYGYTFRELARAYLAGGIKGLVALERIGKTRALEIEARLREKKLIAGEETVPEPAEPKPEAAKPAEKPCETCKQMFVPARPEFKHCPSCHAEWQFKQDFPRTEGKLKGAKKAFGRYNDYGPASVAFEEAKAYFVEGNFEAALAALKEASDKVDTITARGSLEYARGLVDEAEEFGVLVDARIPELVDEVDASLPKEGESGKPWQAAKDAGKLRDLLRPLAREIREAKDRLERAKFVGAPVETFVDLGTREALETMGRERDRERGQRTKREAGSRPKKRYKRPSPGELQQIVDEQLAEAEAEA